jgi:hypothetical protein
MIALGRAARASALDVEVKRAVGSSVYPLSPPAPQTAMVGEKTTAG